MSGCSRQMGADPEIRKTCHSLQFFRGLPSLYCDETGHRISINTAFNIRSMLKTKATTRTRILLADDSPAVLAGIRRLLDSEFEIVGCVSDGLSLVAAAKTLRPDV